MTPGAHRTVIHGGEARFATPIDAFAYGDHRVGGGLTDVVPRFSGRISSDGVRAGHYHVYGSRFDPRSHRIAIVRELVGLSSTVSMSHVDGLRDGRGWAFREATGPDPVNGFTLLRQAYEATDPDYDGPVLMPLLWDRPAGRVVSDDADTIDADLASAFASSSDSGRLYPPAARERIDAVSRQIRGLERTVTRAVFRKDARDELHQWWHKIDEHLTRRRFLMGSRLTLADIRLWVLLVRYDVGPNANGATGAPLSVYPNLWKYARNLYARPAFRSTTDFTAFSAPLTSLPDWAKVGRGPGPSRWALIDTT